MASLLSNLVNDLSEGIQFFLKEVKCKFRHNYKKCEKCGIKYKYCDCFFEYTNVKNDLTETNVCVVQVSNHGNNIFMLLLQMGVYPYAYMDDWKYSMKHHSLKKKIFTVS